MPIVHLTEKYSVSCTHETSNTSSCRPPSRTDSLISIGSIFGLLLSGWVVRKIGRQKSLSVAVLPGLLGWAAIGMALNTPMLLLGR